MNTLFAVSHVGSEQPAGIGVVELVSLVSDTPPTETVPATSMSTEPAVLDVMSTVQDPPLVRHVLPATNVAPAVLLDRLNVSVVPSGTLVKPLPPSPPGAPAASPSFCWNVPVRVWFEPIGFVAVCGVIMMRASTNRFVASPEFPLRPSVSRWSDTPPTVRSTLACAVTRPAEGEVNVITHWPLLFRLSPDGWLSSHVELPPSSTNVDPFAFESVTSTLPTVAGVNPVTPSPPWAAVRPSSWVTVAVKVWGSPTPFTSSAAIEILASTNRLTASPELPLALLVSRCSATPPTVRSTEACPVMIPAEFEVNTTVHWPLASRLSPEGWASSQLLAAAFSTALAPLEPVSVTSTLPTVAGVNPVTPSPPWAAVRPSSWVTVAVKVWGSPTPFTSSAAIEILASTNRLTASPELLPVPSVSRTRVTPSTTRVTVACPVTCPALGEVNTIVH